LSIRFNGNSEVAYFYCATLYTALQTRRRRSPVFENAFTSFFIFRRLESVKQCLTFTLISAPSVESFRHHLKTFLFWGEVYQKAPIKRRRNSQGLGLCQCSTIYRALAITSQLWRGRLKMLF